MPKFPAFPTSFLPIPKVVEEPTQTPTARAESMNLRTITNKRETVAEEPEKITSLNLTNEEEEEKHEIATTTTKETDKVGEKMNPMKRKLRYKVSGRKSTCRAK
ncbi:hypothetical protein PVK06_040790 [Gossypium arboreum]|uniref:Uncharacterized protein n=1 Tax=Gossypium arboreum TaxID=29729 RepID=A0ABR0N6G5_GOSAR|nr:hypothetical protein PVK06_040790 [Gossypium arboreum]